MRKRWIVAFEIIQLFLYLIYSQTMTSSCMRIGDGSASAEREENVNRRREREKEPLHYLPCSFVHIIYTRAGDFLISTGCMVKWHLRVCACGFLWFILREEAQLTLGGISAHEANQTRASARLWPSAYAAAAAVVANYFSSFLCAEFHPLISPDMFAFYVRDGRFVFIYLQVRRAFLRIEKLKVNERQRAGEREMKSEYSTAKPVLWSTKLDNEVVEVLISLHKHNISSLRICDLIFSSVRIYIHAKVVQITPKE